jgi:hypothetical protein
MMKNKFIGFLILLIVAAACNPSGGGQKNDDGQFEIKKYSYKQSEEMTPYLKAEVSYFQVAGDDKLAKSINKLLLSPYDGKISNVPENPDELVEKHFREQMADIKNMLEEVGGTELLPYEFVYNASPVLNNGRVFSFKQSFYNYTGGAHGMSGELYYNYDVNNGKEISLLTLFSAKELQQLNAYGEELFRKQQEIPEGQDFTDAGYFFDDGFYLPNNVLMTDKGLQFYYAPYEVGPYSLGDIKLFIPYEQLEKLLSIEKPLIVALNKIDRFSSAEARSIAASTDHNRDSRIQIC